MASKKVKNAIKNVAKAAIGSFEPSKGRVTKAIAEKAKAKTLSFNEKASEASTIRNTLGRKSIAKKAPSSGTSSIKKSLGSSSSSKSVTRGSLADTAAKASRSLKSSSSGKKMAKKLTPRKTTNTNAPSLSAGKSSFAKKIY